MWRLLLLPYPRYVVCDEVGVGDGGRIELVRRAGGKPLVETRRHACFLRVG